MTFGLTRIGLCEGFVNTEQKHCSNCIQAGRSRRRIERPQPDLSLTVRADIVIEVPKN